MKINLKGCKNKTFLELKFGDTFLFDGNVYMKGKDYNGFEVAISLKDGTVFNVENDIHDVLLDMVDDVICLESELNVVHTPF